MSNFVVMIDFQFLGIHVEAEDKQQAQDKALKALDNLNTEREASGVTGIEYGYRSIRVKEYDDE